MAASETDPQDFQDEEITLEEVLYWLEFGSWTTICLCPFLYYINGPSVSPDQAYVRSGLVVVSIVGAIGLRGYKLLKQRREPDGESMSDV